MRKYTANYSHSNHNFVIQNLKGNRISNKYLPGICILKNILQRGKPTLTSCFLQDQKLGKLHKRSDFRQAYPLIDSTLPKWERIIRGDVKGNYYPAKQFFEDKLPKYLPEYCFVQSLIIPEVPINEITKVDVDEFAHQQVDFYLPQAYLIIEIDGAQHYQDKDKDERRDNHTKKYGIQTVRIKTSDLAAENAHFVNCIQKIKKRIEKVNSKQSQRKEDEPYFISLTDYKTAYEKGVDLSNPNYLSTAIIRFQLLILDLLEYGHLDFKDNWKIELLERDVKGFAKLAIADLFEWFTNIFKLQKISFQKPDVKIFKVKNRRNFSSAKDTIKVDFSLLKRYTDEFQVNPDIIFVRTDYLDEYLYFKQGDSRDKLSFNSFKPYDYFKIATTEPVKYNLKYGNEYSDEEPLRFLLWNVFLQKESDLNYDELKFNEGQIPIIANALARNDTIGLLPTGGGKSVCYQLSAILQPAISFVVCPIKALMFDQKDDLDKIFFHRTNHITSDNDQEDKEKIQNEFGQGKYLFIFISPERFQVKTFREYFSTVNARFHIAYAVVDEVHCLSEWGHDFRTSYLNLSKTIQRHCKDFNFLGLTATASLRVLKDIQIEFGIEQENVKTRLDYSRNELEFIVRGDKGDKRKEIYETLDHLINTIGALVESGKDSKCGIVFTPNVNGSNGCYPLSKDLSEHFGKTIKYYSGSVPKV